MINIMNKDEQRWLKSIYKVFAKFEEEFIIVFLCGGVSKFSDKYLRDKTRTWLENVKSPHIKVFYPEDLLVDVLNKTKDADLLNYEQLLANNSHIICIICESAGALVELGAFTNNSYTVNKVIAAIDKKRTKDKSFIMLGPIKYLSKLDKINVVEYGQKVDKFEENLLKSIKSKYNNKNDKGMKLSTIMGMHYYIQLLLYFFKQLNSKELAEVIKYTAKIKGIDLYEFDVVFSASLKLLFHENSIIKINKSQYSEYKLSRTGHAAIVKLIRSCTNVYECDNIRTDIMYYNYYKSSRS